jgi:hypothetical protein
MSAAAVAMAVVLAAGVAGAATGPVARPDRYIGRVGQPLVVPVAAGVLANDDGATAVRATGPAHGTLSLARNGSFTYRPHAGYRGWDRFTYRARQGTATSAPAAVRVLVNGPPVVRPDGYTVAVGGALHVKPPGLLANDTDPDTATPSLRAQRVRGPAHGVATIGLYGRLHYRPDTGFTGTDTLTYRARDAYGFWSAPALVTIQVGAVNRPPIGAPDSYTTGEDIPIEMSAPGVLANDSDPDGDALVAEQLTGTQHGGVSLASDGSFIFDPGIDADFDVSFTYRVGDGRSWSGPITVSIDLVAANDPPEAVDDYYGFTAGSTAVIEAPGVLENDFDPVENDLLVAHLLTQPATGTVTLDGAGGFTFVADPGEYRWDSFMYNACDPGGCAMAQATLEIFEAN